MCENVSEINDICVLCRVFVTPEQNLRRTQKQKNIFLNQGPFTKQ